MRSYRNHLLSQLPAAELAQLEQDLTPVELPLRAEMISPDGPIEYLHFIEAGLGSEVAIDGVRDQIEVGVIGRDGVIGLPVVLGRNRTPHRTFIQIAGHAFRIPADKLVPALEVNPTLRASLLAYTHSFMLQLAQTALANGRFKIQPRLARWILMCHDRIDGDDIPITHEFLGLMLGIRRAGVTEALAALEVQGVIHPGKGKILIKDRRSLEKIAGSIYGPNHSMPKT